MPRPESQHREEEMAAEKSNSWLHKIRGKIKVALLGLTVLHGGEEKVREQPKNELLIQMDGKDLKFSEIEALAEPLKTGEGFEERILKYPVSDAAKDLIQHIDTKESLVPFEEGLSSHGHPFIARDTVAKAFHLAEACAQDQGVYLKPISSHRTLEFQLQLLSEASPHERGTLVAEGNKSTHRTGGALDVILCKEDANLCEIRSDQLTPTRRGKVEDFDSTDIELLHKCMNAAGFVNLSSETHHFEMGTPAWRELMEKAGILKPSEQPSIYRNIEQPSGHHKGPEFV